MNEIVRYTIFNLLQDRMVSVTFTCEKRCKRLNMCTKLFKLQIPEVGDRFEVKIEETRTVMTVIIADFTWPLIHLQVKMITSHVPTGFSCTVEHVVVN